MNLPRRTFLRGLGTAIALPMLEAMFPAMQAVAGVAGAGKQPLRMAFLYVPNGAHMPDWTPAATGSDFELPYILEPLQQFKRNMTVLSGLAHDRGRGNGDGGGDHARSAGSWLTGVQPLKSEQSRIRAGVSADQVAAAVAGKQTRFASIELGLEPGAQAGKCDSGYSCVYSNNISWRDESTPMTREINPRLVFERLFGNGVSKEVGENQARRLRNRKSVLDFVMDDAQSLGSQVGGADRGKLDEYLSAIREIEQRVESAERASAGAKVQLAEGFEVPEGIPVDYEEHARLMCDLLVLAFQSDVTRISTFMLGNESSNHAYRNLNITEGHHSISHHQGDPAKHALIREINRFHVRQFAYLLGRLKSIPEGDGTLLDNSMIVYGSGLADGDRHDHNDLPLILAGGGGGTITPGRHIRYPDETPMSNLLVSMLERMGSPVDTFGDSTGSLRGLDA